MAAFILILGLLQIAGGILVGMAAKSAIHEILGAIAFGLGVITFALAVLISKFDDFVKSRTPVVAAVDQLSDVKTVPAKGWVKQ